MEITKMNNEYINNLSLPKNKEYLDYLINDRCFTLETIKRFQLGVDNKGQITIPLIKNGEIIGIKRRTNPFKPEEGKKYVNPKGVSNLIFNESTISKGIKHLLICEGEFDVMSLEQYKINAVCQTTGAGFDLEKLNGYLEKHEELTIIIGFDNDKTGKRKMFNIAEKTKELDRIKYCTIKDHKDWNEFISKNAYLKENIKGMRDLMKEKIFRKEKDSVITAKEYITLHNKEFKVNKIFLPTKPLSEYEDTEISFLVDPLIVENGINLITAPAKSLKSMIVLNLCICCIRNQDFLGKYKTKPISIVLLIDQENLKSEIKNRIKKMGGDESNFIINKFPVYFDNDNEITAKILGTLEKDKVDLIVIDTLRRTNLKMNENNSEDINNFFSKIIPLKEHATIIILHHETKPTPLNKTTYFRGSGDIVAAVDNHLSIKKEKKQDLITLTIELKNARYSMELDPIEVDFEFNDDKFRFSNIRNATESQLIKRQERDQQRKEALLSFIHDSKEEGRSTQEINAYMQENHEIAEATTRGLRTELENEELIYRKDNHKGRSTYFFSKEFSSSAPQ